MSVRVRAFVVICAALAGLAQVASAFPPGTEKDQPSKTPVKAAVMIELPEAVTSFGGAILDGWLYVYSGHTGTAHTHSKKHLSTRFVRLKIAEGKTWEELPMGPPCQGVALVPANGKLIRVGGMQAHNAPEDKEDMHSLASVASYDPQTREWTALPDLPEPRSTHDAVADGSKVYVVGGWNLRGASEDAKWADNVLMLDLAAKEPTWQVVAEQPFRRRALAAAVADGQLYVLGGIQEDGKVTAEVNRLDLATKTWSAAPELPLAKSRIKGFGVSAYTLGKRVFCSGMDGKLYSLTDGGWGVSGELAGPRFFHRLLPIGPQAFVVVGGANMETGYVGTVERVEVLPDAAP